MTLELLTHLMRGVVVLWLVLIGTVAVVAARRALQARRRRRTYWQDLVRHYRTSAALTSRWSDE